MAVGHEQRQSNEGKYQTGLVPKKTRERAKSGVNSHLGSKQMKEVRRTDILEVTDTMLKRNVDRQAKITFSDMKQFFRFAVEREVLPANPAADIKKSDIGKKQVPRDRFLPPHEIRQLHQQMLASNLNRPTQISYLICLSTLCRVCEIAQAEWKEIDWTRKTWTIPPEHAKNGQQITVNLSQFALDNFNELRTYNGDCGWCMPNTKRDGPVYEKTLTKHAHDRQLPLGRAPVKGRTIQTRSLVVGRENWTPHDLRRSGSTLMQNLGFSTEIAERCLNHVVHNKVQKAYLHHNPLKEMNRAWRDLGQALGVIIGPNGDKFLEELEADFHRDADDEIGILALTKKFHAKSLETPE